VSAAAARPLVNRRTFRVQWGECDAAQIVFYPNYFIWFDEATAALLEKAGMSQRMMVEAGGVGIPLVDARASFIIPASHGDDLEIESFVERWGNKSFTVRHRIYKDGKLAADGYETRIWGGRDPADERRLKAIPIPAEIKARLSEA
jgi:4-hydroxybenzoyl-CoA thioesterase